jgi:Helix-turn-helix domain
MSFTRLADVFAYLNSEQSRQDGITSHDYCLLTALANYTSPDGAPAYPSLPHLCQLTRLKRTTVKASLKHLERLGLLSRTITRGVHGFSLYTLLVPKGSCGDPLPTAKGSCGDPLPPAKGRVATSKGSCGDPNPVRDPGKKEKMRAHAPEEREKQERHLAWLGVTPDSDVWKAGMNGYLTATTDSSD